MLSSENQFKNASARIREAMHDKNIINQKELAKIAGISEPSLSQYLKGSHAPSNPAAKKLGKVLGVNPLWLMGFEDAPKEPPELSNSGLPKNIMIEHKNKDEAEIEQAKRMLMYYDKLKSYEKDMFFNAIKALAEKEGDPHA